MFKDFIGKVKALLRGEVPPSRFGPVRPTNQLCYACRKPIEGEGFVTVGRADVGVVAVSRRYCEEACAPPFLRLAGDPR